jgi:hypothetical protein
MRTHSTFLIAALVVALQGVMVTSAFAAYTEQWIPNDDIARQSKPARGNPPTVKPKTRKTDAKTHKPSAKAVADPDDPIAAFARPQTRKTH